MQSPRNDEQYEAEENQDKATLIFPSGRQDQQQGG
jgi:hypothetical protein